MTAGKQARKVGRVEGEKVKNKKNKKKKKKKTYTNIKK